MDFGNPPPFYAFSGVIGVEEKIGGVGGGYTLSGLLSRFALLLGSNFLFS